MPTDWFILGRNGDEVAIYLFDDIPSNAEDFFAQLRDIRAPKAVDLFVNCMGGDLYSAMAIHDRLKRFAESGCVIRAFVEGVAASGAALIVSAADEVFVREDASLMVHSPSYVDGREPDERLEVMKVGMARRIAAKLGCAKDAVLDVFREGRWLGAGEAVELGLADVVLGDEGLTT